MTTSNTPTISIIVPVHNGGDKFRRCLLSLKDTNPGPGEIIVVADGDTDGSWQLAQASGVQVLRTSTAGGPARARNLGALSAKGDILFFVDADVVVPPDVVGQIETVFQQQPDLAAVIGSYDDQPLETNFLSQYRNLFHHYVHQISKKEAATFWGACGAIRREIFFKIGGFDEEYRRPAIEDIELGYRLKRAGHRIHLVKGLMVTHLKRWEALMMLKTDFFCRALPWTRLLLSEGRFDNDLNLNIQSRISVMLINLFILNLVGAVFLLSLNGAVVLPWPLLVAVGIIVGLLVLNWDVYRFFKTKRGLIFTLMTIPWHWLYFLYSGLAFAVGYAGFKLQKIKKASRNVLIPRWYHR